MTKKEHQFFSFIYKRQAIWYRRFVLQQTAPWTDDPILQTFKFCNVYRELDKSTIYLLQKLEPLTDKKSQLLNIIFYRFFNQDKLYENLGIEPFSVISKQTKKQLQQGFTNMRKRGQTLFNTAYIISPGTSRLPKHRTILNNLEKISQNAETIIRQLETCKTPEQAFQILIDNIPLAGPFLACEIWTDLSYINFFPQGWTDNDFVNIGPGAKWGLEIMSSKKLSKTIQQQQLSHLYHIQKKILPKIHQTLERKESWQQIAYKQAYTNYPFLSITNIEGSLCEFRKYTNLSNGKGRRRYYKY